MTAQSRKVRVLPPERSHGTLLNARRPSVRFGFTLIELLVVVGAIIVMMALAIRAMNAIRGNGDFMGEVYDISGLVEQARAYAMANNTYTLAGIMEVSGSVSGSAAVQPEVAGGAVG